MDSRLTQISSHEVVVRPSGSGDETALWRLAALDSRRLAHGPMLVATRDGALLAAVPIERGEAIADPFQPTADLVALLELRAEQLHSRERPLPDWRDRDLVSPTARLGRLAVRGR